MPVVAGVADLVQRAILEPQFGRALHRNDVGLKGIGQPADFESVENVSLLDLTAGKIARLDRSVRQPPAEYAALFVLDQIIRQAIERVAVDRIALLAAVKNGAIVAREIDRSLAVPAD